jgi:hypothetical protein
MNKEQFRAALKRNGLTVDEFAELIGKSERTVYSFGARYPVPIYARVILELIEARGGLVGFAVSSKREGCVA